MSTKDDLVQGVINKAAVEIGRYWEILNPNRTPLSEADRAKLPDMAQELLTQKQLTFANGKVVDFQAISTDARYADTKKKLTEYGFPVDSILKLGDTLKDEDKLGKVTAAIDRGVKKSDSLWDTIVDFIMSAITWVVSGFKSSFWENMGKRGGIRAANNVDKELLALAKDPDLAPAVAMMRKGVSETILKKAVEKATGTTPPAGETVANVQPLPVVPGELRPRVEKEVRDGVAAGLKENDSLIASAVGGNDPTKKAAFGAAVEGVFVKAVTSKEGTVAGGKAIRDMNDQELRGALQQDLTAALGSLTFKDGSTLATAYDKSWGKTAANWTNWARSEEGQLPNKSEVLPAYIAKKIVDGLKPETLEDLRRGNRFAAADFTANIGPLLPNLEALVQAARTAPVDSQRQTPPPPKPAQGVSPPPR